MEDAVVEENNPAMTPAYDKQTTLKRAKPPTSIQLLAIRQADWTLRLRALTDADLI